ncbi:unnamed protein product, partial [Brassica oleracea]
DATALACDYGIATSLPPHRALSDASTVSIYFMMHPLSIASALEKHIYCKICISMNSLSVFLAGVESFDVDIKEQKVTVKGNVQPDAVLQTVSKTGKKSAFWDTEAETAKA